MPQHSASPAPAVEGEGSLSRAHPLGSTGAARFGEFTPVFGPPATPTPACALTQAAAQLPPAPTKNKVLGVKELQRLDLLLLDTDEGKAALLAYTERDPAAAADGEDGLDERESTVVNAAKKLRTLQADKYPGRGAKKPTDKTMQSRVTKCLLKGAARWFDTTAAAFQKTPEYRALKKIFDAADGCKCPPTLCA